MSKKELQWTKFSTPATKYTREIGFVVSVDADESFIGTSDMPVEGTTYGNSPIQPKPYADKLDADGVAFSTYVCTKVEGSARWSFYFGKPKTLAQANTRYHWEIKSENYPWEGVLLNYRNEADFRQALEMRDSGGNQFFQQKWGTRYDLLAPIQGATDILYEYFISPTKWANLRRPTIQQPRYVPAGHLPGDTSEPIGNVLIAKRIRVALKVLGPVALEERKYEPTIPAGRVRHIIDEDQNQLDTGLYIKLRKTAIPPVGGRIIRDR